jgi:DNA-binding NtrC family response regulator
MAPLSFAHADQSCQSQQQPRVVVADDVDVFRMIISETFRSNGYHVEEAKSGSELCEWLTQITQHPDERPPALVVTTTCFLSDSGLGTLLGLKAHKLGIPLILLSRTGERRTQIYNPEGDELAVNCRPFALDELRGIACKLLEPSDAHEEERHSTIQRVRTSTVHRHGFDGESP